MARRFRSLFVTDVYPTQGQLLGNFVREHARAVSLYDDVAVMHVVGWTPTLSCSWHVVQETDQALTYGIPTYRTWHRRLLIGHRGLSIPKTALVVSIWGTFRTVMKLQSLGFRPDVIHAFRYSVGMPAVLISRILRVPLVLTEESAVFIKESPSHNQIRRAQRVCRFAKAILPVSHAVEEGMRRHEIGGNFRVVPNPVDTGLFYPKSRGNGSQQEKRLLFVGRLTPEKGVQVLLEALAKLERVRHDWRCDVIGDGPTRTENEHLAKCLNLRDRVTFQGMKPRHVIAEAMRQADLVVIPSVYETFSMVAAEALATGTPVLSTRCGGPEDFVGNEVGMLVSPGNAEVLCGALGNMLDRLSSFEPQQLAYYAASRFGLEAVGRQIHGLYEEIC